MRQMKSLQERPLSSVKDHVPLRRILHKAITVSNKQPVMQISRIKSMIRWKVPSATTSINRSNGCSSKQSRYSQKVRQFHYRPSPSCSRSRITTTSDWQTSSFPYKTTPITPSEAFPYPSPQPATTSPSASHTRRAHGRHCRATHASSTPSPRLQNYSVTTMSKRASSVYKSLKVKRMPSIFSTTNTRRQFSINWLKIIRQYLPNHSLTSSSTQRSRSITISINPFREEKGTVMLQETAENPQQSLITTTVSRTINQEAGLKE